MPRSNVPWMRTSQNHDPALFELVVCSPFYWMVGSDPLPYIAGISSILIIPDFACSLSSIINRQLTIR